MSTSLVPVATSTDVTTQQDRPLTVQEVVGRVELVHEISRKVMREGEHFGFIPGTDRPRKRGKDGKEEPPKKSLLKPGAEVLGLAFGLVPEFHSEVRIFDGGHREYEFTCRLLTRGGKFAGEGVGTCSTMESKYRYRWENTWQLVPKEYWEDRDASILGGPTFVPRKAYGKDDKQAWYIFQKVEHPDPADHWNTCKKIGKKRAYIDAVITATNCSSDFTQDVEDIVEDIVENEKIHRTEATVIPEAPAKKPEWMNAPTNRPADCVGGVVHDILSGPACQFEAPQEEQGRVAAPPSQPPPPAAPSAPPEQPKPLQPTPESAKHPRKAATDKPAKDAPWPRVEGGITEKQNKFLWAKFFAQEKQANGMSKDDFNDLLVAHGAVDHRSDTLPAASMTAVVEALTGKV